MWPILSSTHKRSCLLSKLGGKSCCENVIWDNYSKPTCGMTRFHFAYPWFNYLHFDHLRLVPLAFRNLPLRLLL